MDPELWVGIGLALLSGGIATWTVVYGRRNEERTTRTLAQQAERSGLWEGYDEHTGRLLEDLARMTARNEKLTDENDALRAELWDARKREDVDAQALEFLRREAGYPAPFDVSDYLAKVKPPKWQR